MGRDRVHRERLNVVLLKGGVVRGPRLALVQAAGLIAPLFPGGRGRASAGAGIAASIPHTHSHTSPRFTHAH